MNRENCRLCENCCKCCAKNRYKDDCDLCNDYDSFALADHIKHCPASGEQMELPRKQSKPVVLIRGTGRNEKELKEAMEKYFKEHGELRL